MLLVLSNEDLQEKFELAQVDMDRNEARIAALQSQITEAEDMREDAKALEYRAQQAQAEAELRTSESKAAVTSRDRATGDSQTITAQFRQGRTN